MKLQQINAHKNRVLLLSSYSAIASAILSSGNTFAQIGYTDIDPDSTIYIYDTLTVDINQDNEVDLIFNIQYGINASYTYAFKVAGKNPSSIEFKGQYSNQSGYGCSTNWTWSYPIASCVGVNEKIDSNVNWLNNINKPVVLFFEEKNKCTGSIKMGEWKDQFNKYLGIRMNDGSNNFNYGWVRLSVDYYDLKLTVSDFAYNLQANSPINCGDTSSSSSIITKTEMNNNKITLYSYANKIFIHKDDARITTGYIKIINLTGEIVYEKSIDLSNSAIIIPNVKPNTYFVEIITKYESITKKIFIGN